jgi:histone H3/H4
MIESLVAKRDARKDAFAATIRKAMETKLGADADEAFKAVCSHGIPRAVAKDALQIAQEKGRLTVWAVVDALTRLAQNHKYAGDRTEADQTASALLTLVS